MGFRTVVMLNNDQHSQWSEDPDLGAKVSRGMNGLHHSLKPGQYRWETPAYLGYGQVVECVHADTQTLAILDRYTDFTPCGYSSFRQNDSVDEMKLRLLKEAADELGYTLRKKPVQD